MTHLLCWCWLNALPYRLIKRSTTKIYATDHRKSSWPCSTSQTNRTVSTWCHCPEQYARKLLPHKHIAQTKLLGQIAFPHPPTPPPAHQSVGLGWSKCASRLRFFHISTSSSAASLAKRLNKIKKTCCISACTVGYLSVGDGTFQAPR